MYQIKINQKFQFKTAQQKGEIFINDQAVTLDMVKIDENHFHLIYQHCSYKAEVLSMNFVEKILRIKVNQNIYDLEIRDQYDELLKNLGLENLNARKIKEIKAPMPGLVLKIIVKEGDVVKKGENLLVLEAMKMENMIKAPADVIIQKIKVKSGEKVEKNQLLMVLD
ncbi:MAG: biotin/lipoyl-binding protein [Sphingobacteriales bacterium]|nr:biotin/lipoyl-binding protein [Sphingobacteriales bacterium]